MGQGLSEASVYTMGAVASTFEGAVTRIGSYMILNQFESEETLLLQLVL
jgi:hypothetical protein